MSVRVAFHGGLGEIGRNCATIEIDGRIAMVDAGLMFPEEDMLGVDLVLPDYSSVTDRGDALSFVALTHGHEDHIGSLGYLLRERNVPVYGTALTMELAEARVVGARRRRRLSGGRDRHMGRTREVPVRIHPGHPFGAGRNRNRIRDARGASSSTPATSSSIRPRSTALPPTCRASPDSGAVAFGCCWPTQPTRNARVWSSQRRRSAFGSLNSSTRPKGRVLIACFASHLHRVQQAIDAAVADGRKFAFIGRSMLRISEIAGQIGVLEIPDGSLVELNELLKLPPEQTAVISTGSQGEPFAALSLMAAGEHRSIALDPTDTVIISATPIPGNEKRVSRVINNLSRVGVTVHHGRNTHVHVSGHAAAEELKVLYNVVKPEAVVPVHGEHRHLLANAEIARSVGVPEVAVCEDGDVVVLEDGEMRVERGAVSSGYIYVDGLEVGEDKGVLRDRRHLADDGVILITIGVDVRKGDIVFGPDVDSHGVTGDSKELHDAVQARVEQGIETLERPIDPDALRSRIRNSARRGSPEPTSSGRPVVFPVVIKV